MELSSFNDPEKLFMWTLSPEICGKYFFRGISREEQRYPSIMRIEEEMPPFEEERILFDFMRYGSALIGGYTNPFDCISVAQHHGLPTRLIDWTRNPLIALFFAIYNANQDDSADPQLLILPNDEIILISEPLHKVTNEELSMSPLNPVRDYMSFIKQIESGKIVRLCRDAAQINLGIKGPGLDELEERIHSKDQRGCMIMIDSGYSNARILAQDGLFNIPRMLDKPSIQDEYSTSGVRCIHVKREWREYLLQRMKSLGISKYRLFYDLQSICSYIKDEAIELNRQFEISSTTI